MSEDKNKRKLSTFQEGTPGMFTGLTNTVKLVLRLIGDKRVNFFLKLLPISTLVYLVSPLDAAIPVIDDAAVMALGTYVFIELCPQDVVEEHRARLSGQASAPTQEDDEVIDVEYTASDK